MVSERGGETVRGELVRIETKDGIELVGLYAAPPGRAGRGVPCFTSTGSPGTSTRTGS